MSFCHCRELPAVQSAAALLVHRLLLAQHAPCLDRSEKFCSRSSKAWGQYEQLASVQRGQVPHWPADTGTLSAHFWPPPFHQRVRAAPVLHSICTHTSFIHSYHCVFEPDRSKTVPAPAAAETTPHHRCLPLLSLLSRLQGQGGGSWVGTQQHGRPAWLHMQPGTAANQQIPSAAAQRLQQAGAAGALAPAACSPQAAPCGPCVVLITVLPTASSRSCCPWPCDCSAASVLWGPAWLLGSTTARSVGRLSTTSMVLLHVQSILQG